MWLIVASHNSHLSEGLSYIARAQNDSALERCITITEVSQTPAIMGLPADNGVTPIHVSYVYKGRHSSHLDIMNMMDKVVPFSHTTTPRW